MDGVEHLLAALGGLGIRRGVALEVEGGEVPLADGGAAAFAEALGGLGLTSEEPPLCVLRNDEVRVEESTYAFSVADSVKVEVTVDFDVPAIGVQKASWNGTKTAFLRDIAWARTFGFRRDSDMLRAAGRGQGVDPEHVMVLDDEGRVERPYTPARPGEFARHKLLDLVGDLYLHGGPPSGRVSATRPGHAATHRAVRLALEREIIGPGRSASPL